MPERSGEPNKLLVMYLMMMGVSPFSIGGRHDGHACCSYLRLSLEVNLLWGSCTRLLRSYVRVGKGNRAKRSFRDGLIRPCTNKAKRLLLGTTCCWRANLGNAHTRMHPECGSRCRYTTGQGLAALALSCPHSPKYVLQQQRFSSQASLSALSYILGEQRRGVTT
jgi:hypothetical protein